MSNFSDTEREDENIDNEEDFLPTDPFEGLTKGEQDVFFRILDLLPRTQLEPAMEYFFSHPLKIRAVVAYVKQKKQLIKEKNTEELKKLFAQEQIVLEKLQVNDENEMEGMPLENIS